MAAGNVEEVRDPAVRQRAGAAVGVRHRHVVEASRRKRRCRGRDLVVARDVHSRRGEPADRHPGAGEEVETGQRNWRARRGARAGVRGDDDALGELRGVAVGIGGRGGDPFPGLDLGPENDLDRRVAAAVRRDLGRAQVGLSLEESLGPPDAGRVRVEIDVVGRVGKAVQAARDHRAARGRAPARPIR